MFLLLLFTTVSAWQIDVMHLDNCSGPISHVRGYTGSACVGEACRCVSFTGLQTYCVEVVCNGAIIPPVPVNMMAWTTHAVRFPRDFTAVPRDGCSFSSLLSQGVDSWTVNCANNGVLQVNQYENVRSCTGTPIVQTFDFDCQGATCSDFTTTNCLQNSADPSSTSVATEITFASILTNEQITDLQNIITHYLQTINNITFSIEVTTPPTYEVKITGPGAGGAANSVLGNLKLNPDFFKEYRPARGVVPSVTNARMTSRDPTTTTAPGVAYCILPQWMLIIILLAIVLL